MDVKRRHKFPYLHRVVTQHGKEAWYFWKRPGQKIRVRGEYGTEEFRQNYWRAVSGDFIAKESEPRQPTMKEFRLEMRVGRGASKSDMNVNQKIAFSVKRAVKRARLRAKEKGIDCDIDFEWAMNRVIENNGLCEITGIRFFDPSGDGHRTHPYTPSIDRIDTAGGYTKGNSRVVTCAANVALNEWGTDVLETVSAAFQKRVKAMSR